MSKSKGEKLVGKFNKMISEVYSVQDFCDIITSKSRSSAGPSVKAKGLFLTKVDYNNNA